MFSLSPYLRNCSADVLFFNSVTFETTDIAVDDDVVNIVVTLLVTLPKSVSFPDVVPLAAAPVRGMQTSAS
jgi:hypothetical protein